MEKNRSLISKEPELQKIIEKKRQELFKKEEELFKLVEELVAIKSSIKTFYLKVYLPKIGNYIEELENLKDKMLGIKKTIKEEDFLKNEDKTELTPELKKELKILYRKLAKLYHPDNIKNLNKQDKIFFTKRMSEINEAFKKQDIETLRRIFKKAETEIGFNMSSIERIRNFEIDLNILDQMEKLYKAKIENLKSDQIYKLMLKSPKEREKVFEDIKIRYIEDIKLYKGIYLKLKNTMQ